MTGDCRDCKDYRECVSPPEWFHYGQIRFCIYQVIWILRNADTLRAGRWPKNPDSVDDNAGQRRIKTEASFVPSIVILAEVEARLIGEDEEHWNTGLSGKLLVAQIEAGREFDTLDRDARTALLYIKGYRRKKESFNAWKKRRNYRQKRHQKVLMVEA